MDWDLARVQSGVAIGGISYNTAFPVGHGREILALLSGSIRQKFPTGKTPKQAATFIRRFMEVKSEFPPSDIQVPRWVHSTMTFRGRRWFALLSNNWKKH